MNSKNDYKTGDLVALRKNIMGDMIAGLKGEVIDIKADTIVVIWENNACLEISIDKVLRIS